jgi:hypothetical protein
MSAVIVEPRDWDGFQLWLERLAEQTVASTLELVVVTPRARELDLDGVLLECLWGWQIVEWRDSRHHGAGKAAGAWAARAPLVAFAEDHAFPQREWAESLIRTHKTQGCAAAGPMMCNANPATATSWAAFLVFYSFALGGGAVREVDSVPGNQSCYRRDVLLASEPGLAEKLDSETTLQAELRARGYRLLQQPEARVNHMNPSRLWPSALEYFHSSRIFAHQRSQGWSTFRRMCYAAGCPLIPAIRLPRIIRAARLAGVDQRILLRALPAMTAILASGALGEMAGFATGPGRAADALASFEEQRAAWFQKSDLVEAARR